MGYCSITLVEDDKGRAPSNVPPQYDLQGGGSHMTEEVSCDPGVMMMMMVADNE